MIRTVGVSLDDYIMSKVNIDKTGKPISNRSERIKELILKGLEKEQEEKLIEIMNKN